MGRKLDLTGQKFNRLTAVKPTDQRVRGQIIWELVCDCGNIHYAGASNVKNGSIKSCGCSREKDFTGVKVGKLTVLHKSPQQPSTKRGNIVWVCQCECGNLTEKESGDLHKAIENNRNSTCGCYKGANDLIGKRFGKLTVIKDDIVQSFHRKWLCKCDCGKEVIVFGFSLLRGNTQSCGCITGSIGENHIAILLEQNNIAYQREWIFSDLKNANNAFLRYDFAIFDGNNNLVRLVEFDGLQHTDPDYKLWGVSKYETIVYHDRLKNDYALSHNIPLIRVPYSKRDNIILDDIFSNEFLVKGE